MVRWLAGLRRPASSEWADRVTWWAVAAYSALVLLSALTLWTLADRWWAATVLLFGPRWVLLLPLVPLLAAAAWRDRALVVPLCAAAWVVVFPVMGFQTGWRSALVASDEAASLRVATFNARGGDGVAMGPNSLMAEWRADVAAIQECGGVLRSSIRATSDWHTRTEGSLCVISRYPILESATMEREVIRQAGGSGLATTVLLAAQPTAFRLTNIHLETPREGLAPIRRGRLGTGIRVTREKSLLRAIELRRVRRWVDGFEGPHIVAGDFNTPSESRAYREAWAGWANAFGVAGFGLGGTRLNGWIRARIDHVLTSAEWRVVDAHLGEPLGSDHLPMVAELRLR
jgi:endonuclease/exonuclease/phosphatase (EEP) superfamily protein YafD